MLREGQRHFWKVDTFRKKISDTSPESPGKPVFKRSNFVKHQIYRDFLGLSTRYVAMFLRSQVLRPFFGAKGVVLEYSSGRETIGQDPLRRIRLQFWYWKFPIKTLSFVISLAIKVIFIIFQHPSQFPSDISGGGLLDLNFLGGGGGGACHLSGPKLLVSYVHILLHILYLTQLNLKHLTYLE